MLSTSRLAAYCFSAALLFTLSAVTTNTAEASHFRYGTVSWVSTGNPGEVEFRAKIAMVGGGTVGQTVQFANFTFGDGSSAVPAFILTSVNSTTGVIIGEATFRHTYAGQGTFTAQFITCCRIYGIVNASSANFNLRTVVTPSGSNSSPVSNQLPVINVSQSSSASFSVPASDANGDVLNFRLATPSESGIPSLPPGLTINSTTGFVTWNTATLTINALYAVQVMVEDLDGSGNVKSKTPVDFLMKIVGQIGQPPVCELSDPGPFATVVDGTVAFTVTGTDPDAGAVITIDASGVPPGATMTPTVPVTGASGTGTTFNWVPALNQSGSYVTTFSITDNSGQQALCSAKIDVTTNRPPVADDKSVTTDEDAAINIVITGSDPDSDPLSYAVSTVPTSGSLTGTAPNLVYTPAPNFHGSVSFTFVVNDGTVNSDPATVTITVDSVNDSPVAVASQDQELECTSSRGTTAWLDGSGSSDIDGDALTYTWTNAAGDVIATGVAPSVVLPVGSNTIALTVDDGNGGTSSDQIVIDIVDTTVPVITVAGEPVLLWSPNHKYHTINVSDVVVSVTDQCSGDLGLSSVAIASVSSDEPDETAGATNKGSRGGGDGNMPNDIVIQDCQMVDLRAERLGGGNGRVYTLSLNAFDINGNTGEAAFEVHVPRNQDIPGTLAVVDADAYSVTGAASCLTAPASTDAIAIAADEPSTIVPGRISNTFGAGDLKASAELPTQASLDQNYPNPFNPSTVISFALPEASNVSVRVFNVMGQEIARLAYGNYAAGRHDVSFDASHLSNGIYIYAMEAGSFKSVKRMTLLK